jgi:thymidylate synthase
MNTLDAQYINLLRQIRDKGIWEDNRTGIPAKAIVGAMIQHDMSEGFPLLCCKRHSFKNIAVELEFFIRGLSSKGWLQDRGCHIWDEWCNPQRGIAGTKEMMEQHALREDDLGRIYGVQWRGFRGAAQPNTEDYIYTENDQLVELLALLRRDPTSRRAIVTAWNPCELNQMALPPCHVMWQAMILGGKLHLTWYQRSVDTPLGLPYNIASYGLLLHLLARELGVGEGTLTGMLNNVHYYKNQEEAVNEIIERGEEVFIDIQPLPTINTDPIASLKMTLGDNSIDNGFNGHVSWSYELTKLQDYNPLPACRIPIAV